MIDRQNRKRAAACLLALLVFASSMAVGAPVLAARPKEPPLVKGLKVRQSPRGGLDVYFKRNKQTDGYRVQFDTNKRFSHPQRVNTSSTKVHIIAKKGKTYYVRVLGFNYDSKRRRVIGKYTKPVKIKVKR